MLLPDPRQVTVGWISPMPLELTPAKLMLEGRQRVFIEHDPNPYHVGRIGEHWVAMAVCPDMGTQEAATLSTHMCRSFRSIKDIFVVGIAGGVPRYGQNGDWPIVLGDVVVGIPRDNEGGVANTAAGARTGETETRPGGHLLHATSGLLAVVGNIRSELEQKIGSDLNITDDLERLYEVLPHSKDPGPDYDRLYPDDYQHVGGKDFKCEGPCDPSLILTRDLRGQYAKRAESSPSWHFGTIASTDQLIVSSAVRNQMQKERGAICFEMEGAGVVADRQALVVRGICDYADSHKVKEWQPYAAATAAVCARAIAARMAPPDLPGLEVLEKVQEVLGKCLRSLAFWEMDRRVSGPAEGTFQWLDGHAAFKAWKESQSLLWIKGKMGAGKSTLLRHALDKVEGVNDGSLILSFFFSGNGQGLEKSPLGFYRAMVHQVLRHIPGVRSMLVNVFKERCSMFGEPGDKWNWTESELQDFLIRVLPGIMSNRQVWIFVDALDESGEDNAIAIFNWLQDLVVKLPQDRKKCHVCVSCRNYPNIIRGTELAICVEDENRGDIEAYVRGEFSRYPQLADSSIPDLVVHRAEGLFLWARLVVCNILKKDRKGESMDELHKAVSEIPQNFDQLYAVILTGMKAESLKLIQWLCYSNRPLSLDELRWAMVVDANSPCRSSKGFEGSTDYIETNDRMERRVRELTGGLADVTATRSSNVSSGVEMYHEWMRRRSKGKEVDGDGDAQITDAGNEPFDFRDLDVVRDLPPSTPVVQFIHQSVKDFFVDDGLLQLEWKAGFVSPASTITETGSWTANNGISYQRPSLGMESRMAGTKAHYALLVTCVRYLTLDEIGTEGLHPKEELDAFPLFRYAANSWEVHLKMCEEGGISTKDILAVFPGKLKNPNSMWKNLNFRVSDVPTHYFLGAMFVHACVLLNARVELSNALNAPDGCVKLYADYPDLDGLTPLLNAMTGFEEPREGLAEALLRARCVDGRRSDQSGYTPLYWAIKMGMCEIVELLVASNPATARYICPEGRDLIYHVRNSNGGHEEEAEFMIRILLGTGHFDVESAEDTDGPATPDANGNIVEPMVNHGIGDEYMDHEQSEQGWRVRSFETAFDNGGSTVGGPEKRPRM